MDIDEVRLLNGEILKLDINNKFPPGGEGTVYPIKNSAKYISHVVKVYHTDEIASARRLKVAYMVKNPPRGLITNNHIICWPQQSVYSGRIFVGFIMPLAFPHSRSLYDICLPKLSSTLPAIWHKKLDRNTPRGVKSRFKVCFNLCSAFHAVHNNTGYAFVDFKPINLLINEKGKISFIDMDSIQIVKSGRIVHAAHVGTPENLPPEAKGKSIETTVVETSWVNFSLAVTLYQVVFGIHPYVSSFKPPFDKISDTQPGIDHGLYVYGKHYDKVQVLAIPHKNMQHVPREIKTLFYRAFEEGNTVPYRRPSAAEWVKVLYTSIDSGAVSNLNFTFGKSKGPPSPPPPTTPTTPTASRKSNRIPAFVYILIFFVLGGFYAANEDNIKEFFNSNSQPEKRLPQKTSTPLPRSSTLKREPIKVLNIPDLDLIEKRIEKCFSLFTTASFTEGDLQDVYSFPVTMGNEQNVYAPELREFISQVDVSNFVFDFVNFHSSLIRKQDTSIYYINAFATIFDDPSYIRTEIKILNNKIKAFTPLEYKNIEDDGYLDFLNSNKTELFRYDPNGYISQENSFLAEGYKRATFTNQELVLFDKTAYKLRGNKFFFLELKSFVKGIFAIILKEDGGIDRYLLTKDRITFLPIVDDLYALDYTLRTKDDFIEYFKVYNSFLFPRSTRLISLKQIPWKADVPKVVYDYMINQFEKRHSLVKQGNDFVADNLFLTDEGIINNVVTSYKRTNTMTRQSETLMNLSPFISFTDFVSYSDDDYGSSSPVLKDYLEENHYKNEWFYFGSAQPTETLIKELDQLLPFLKEDINNKQMFVATPGKEGNLEDVIKLNEARMEAIKMILVRKGILTIQIKSTVSKVRVLDTPFSTFSSYALPSAK